MRIDFYKYKSNYWASYFPHTVSLMVQIIKIQYTKNDDDDVSKQINASLRIKTAGITLASSEVVWSPGRHGSQA